MAIVFVDRQSDYPNRYLMTTEDGTTSFIVLERADEPIVAGTPLNAETFNAFVEDVMKAALGGGLAIPDVAEVGQIIQVTNVSSDGVVLETTAIDPPSDLPEVTSEDEGALLTVDSSGAWAPAGGKLSNLNVSNWENGSFTETFANGEALSHTVTFDANGNPNKIDGVTITW